MLVYWAQKNMLRPADSMLTATTWHSAPTSPLRRKGSSESPRFVRTPRTNRGDSDEPFLRSGEVGAECQVVAVSIESAGLNMFFCAQYTNIGTGGEHQLRSTGRQLSRPVPHVELRHDRALAVVEHRRPQRPDGQIERGALRAIGGVRVNQGHVVRHVVTRELALMRGYDPGA